MEKSAANVLLALRQILVDGQRFFARGVPGCEGILQVDAQPIRVSGAMIQWIAHQKLEVYPRKFLRNWPVPWDISHKQNFSYKLRFGATDSQLMICVPLVNACYSLA